MFDINPIKAWSAVGITLCSVAASLYLISVSPWYLLPFAWFIAGTAFTGVSGWAGVLCVLCVWSVGCGGDRCWCNCLLGTGAGAFVCCVSASNSWGVQRDS